MLSCEYLWLLCILLVCLFCVLFCLEVGQWLDLTPKSVLGILPLAVQFFSLCVLAFCFLLIMVAEAVVIRTSGVSQIAKLDFGDPLYLHPSDTSGTPILNIKLSGTNNYRV